MLEAQETEAQDPRGQGGKLEDREAPDPEGDSIDIGERGK